MQYQNNRRPAPFGTTFDETPQKIVKPGLIRNPAHFSSGQKYVHCYFFQQEDSLSSFIQQNPYQNKPNNNRPAQSIDNTNNQKFVNNYENFYRGSTPDLDLEAQVRSVQIQRKSSIGKKSPGQNIFKPQQQPYINASNGNYSRNENLFWAADSKLSTRNGNFGNYNTPSPQPNRNMTDRPQQHKQNTDFTSNMGKFFDDTETGNQQQNYRPQVKTIQQQPYSKISQAINQPKQKTFENNASQFFGSDTQYSNQNFARASPQQSPQVPKDSFSSNLQNFFAVEDNNASPQRSYNSYNILSRMPCKYQINEGQKVGVKPAAQSRFEVDQQKSKRGNKEMSGFKAQSFNPNMHQNICNFFGEEAPPGYNQSKAKPIINKPYQPSNIYTDKLAELQEQRIRNERSIAQSRLTQMNQMPQKNFFEFESQNVEKQKERCYKNVRGLDVEAGDVYNPMTGKWMKVQRSYQQ